MRRPPFKILASLKFKIYSKSNFYKIIIKAERLFFGLRLNSGLLDLLI